MTWVPARCPSRRSSLRSARSAAEHPREASEAQSMSGRYKVTCSHCDYARSIGSPPRSYALPDGSGMPIPDGFGWCKSCETVTPCETLPALADVERLLVAARSQTDQKLATELDRTRCWLKTRVSPPRCLECGAVDISPFPPGWSVYRSEESDEDFHDIPHPNCHGMLHVEPDAWSLYRDWGPQYSAEGERISDANPLEGLPKG